MKTPIVIAVDGTAASGKGTLAKRLAEHFHFAHLDSGSLYRLVALQLAGSGGNPANEADAALAATRVSAAAIEAAKNNPAIRSAGIGRAASLLSVFPEVRKALLQFQREFAAHPPGGLRGAAIDGRDIGTVVCPNAAAKLFVDAKPEIRAHRRWLELRARGEAADEASLLADLVERDRRDRERVAAPLKPATDALLLDTGDLDIDAAFAAALALTQSKVEDALKALPQGF